MASAFVSCGVVGTKALLGYIPPVLNSQPNVSQLLTTSAANAVSTVTAPQAGAIWTIAAIGGAVYAVFGADPNAATETGARHYIPSGLIRDFAAVAVGEKVALVDA